MSKSYILSRMDWAKAYRDYEELKVGRANEIIGSEIKPNGRWTPNQNVTLRFSNNELEITFNSPNTSSYGAFLDTRDMILDEGIYTLTIEADMSNLSDSSRLGVAFMEGEGVIAGNPRRTYHLPYKESRSFFEVTFEVSTPIKHARILIFVTPVVNAGEKLKVYSAKIEKGSVSTPYTPHPLDINSQPFPAQVAHDMYQATDGNWNKAEKDYELLKVGKTNLLPEVGEQVISGLDSFNHSSHIGIYEGIISNTIYHSNGKQFFFDIKEKVKKNDIFTLSCDFSNNETNLYVVYLYDAEKKIIDTAEGIKTEILNKSIGMTEHANHFYKGFISNNFNDGSSFCFEIVGDKVKFISIGVGMYAHTNMTQPLTVSNWKLERGNTSTPFTPSPESLNASPFTVKLANDYYNQQSEITELRNAILQLGGN